MAWIESHQSLSRHRKTLAVVADLKVDRHKLIGHLHELWWWSLDNATAEGAVGHVSHEVIAEAAGWPSRGADQFVGALLSAGFMEEAETGYMLHDWEEYSGKLVERRSANRVRMRQARAKHVQCTVQGAPGARVQHVQPRAELQERTVEERTVNPLTPLERGRVPRRKNGVDPEQRMEFPNGVQL